MSPRLQAVADAMATTALQQTAEKSGFRCVPVSLRCGATGKQWLCPQRGVALSVERAVLSHFEREGWRGYWGEGGLLLTLIKAMSFRELDYDQRTRYIEALYTLAADAKYDMSYTVDDLLGNLRTATAAQVARNFDHMNSRGPFHETAERFTSSDSTSLQDNWPGLARWMVLELLEVAGHDILHRIASTFASNPYDFRRGWPDITMWKDGQLRFVEVKAPGDKIVSSQKVIASAFARPLELDFCLATVTVQQA